RLQSRISLLTIAFQRQGSGNLGNRGVTLVPRIPVLPVVNRHTHRNATIRQGDFPRITVGVALCSAGLSHKSDIRISLQGIREHLGGGESSWPNDAEKVATTIDTFRLNDASHERHDEGAISTPILA